MSRNMVSDNYISSYASSSNTQRNEMIFSKVNFEKILEEFRPKDTIYLQKYLGDIWKELSDRGNEKGKNLNRLTFSTVLFKFIISKKKFFNFFQYYDLPVIISDRLFNVFANDQKPYLNKNEFVNGLMDLFTGNYKKLIKIIFSLYDFDKDGKVYREDIRIVFSYIPLNSNELLLHYKMKFEQENVNDRKESINEINKTLERIFDSDYIDETFFKYSIENINSDILIYI